MNEYLESQKLAREARRLAHRVSRVVNRPYGTCESFGEIQALRDAVLVLSRAVEAIAKEKNG